MGTDNFTEFTKASVSSPTSKDAVSGNDKQLENRQQSAMPPKELDFTTYSSEDKLQSSKTLNYFVEFCAGSAALSAEMKKAGFSVLPIDLAHNRHRTLAQPVSLDLATDSSKDLVSNMLQAATAFCRAHGLAVRHLQQSKGKAASQKVSGLLQRSSSSSQCRTLDGFARSEWRQFDEGQPSQPAVQECGGFLVCLLHSEYPGFHRESSALLVMGCPHAIGQTIRRSSLFAVVQLVSASRFPCLYTRV